MFGNLPGAPKNAEGTRECELTCMSTQSGTNSCALFLSCAKTAGFARRDREGEEKDSKKGTQRNFQQMAADIPNSSGQYGNQVGNHEGVGRSRRAPERNGKVARHVYLHRS